jgi:hypothetical protein
MMLQRIRKALDPLILPCQAAYREAHNVAMNLLAIQELKERARTTDLPLYCTFVDFSAAFDSVDRAMLFRLCRQWGIPDRFVAFLERSHSQQKLFVRFDGQLDPEPICPTRGVMQGDTLAPFLFVLIVDQILRRLPSNCGALAETRLIPHLLRCCALAYADDVVLLANSLLHAQVLLTQFEIAASCFGLRINTKKGKTELLLVAHPSLRHHLKTDLSCGAGDIQVTHRYKYLGWIITDKPTSNWQDDFNTRKRNAWHVVRTHERVWRASVDDTVKKKVFHALVIPTLTYAAATYPFTATCLTHLHVATNKLLRHCLGRPILWDSPPEHTHTELLYDCFPFAPAIVVKQTLTQWGHWVRRAYAVNNPHPVVTVVAGEVSRARPLRSPPAHPPSRALAVASGLDKVALAMTPNELSRSAWRKLVDTKTRAMATDFALCVVKARRLLDPGCPEPDWRGLVDSWYRKKLLRPR